MRQSIRQSAPALWAAVAGSVLLAQQPTFRSGVAYVGVDVVVTDRDDRLVTDLTLADFRLEAGGRTQTISTFDVVSIPLGDRLVDLKTEPAPPPDVAANVPLAREGRAIVFILDDLTLLAQDIVPIKRTMVELLRSLTRDDRVAITYVRRSDLGQDFTNDLGRLTAAVENLNAAIMPGPALRETLLVLRNVVDSLATAPASRRAIVYVSSGYSSGFAPTKTLTELSSSAFIAERLAEEYEHARQVGVPVYTLDPRGIVDPETVVGIGRLPTPEARAAVQARLVAEQQFMRALAENTGGRAFVAQSDLTGAARQIIAENGSYYLLGFHPTPYEADGKFHDIKVTVTRPGLRVRARDGYLAEKPRPLATSPAMLRDALADGVHGGDLRLRAFAAPVVPSPRGAGTLLTLDVIYPPSAADAPPRQDDDLHLAWVALDPDARIRTSGTRTVTVPLGAAARAGFTLSLHDHLDLPRGLTTLRVAAASQALGAQGTVHLRLDVPRLADDRRLDASALVLGLEGGAPVRVARLDASNASGVPFPATTLRTFAAAGTLHVFARVFNDAPADARAVAALERGGELVRALDVQCGGSPGRAYARDCRALVPLAGLSAGTYAIEFTATREGRDPVTRAVGFEIR